MRRRPAGRGLPRNDGRRLARASSAAGEGEQVAEFCTCAVVAALERAVAADVGARGGLRGALATAFREADAALAASAVDAKGARSSASRGEPGR